MKSLVFHPQNARFWVFIHGGWVKVTLRPGQTLAHSFFTTDEEGYSRESVTFCFDGETVTRCWHDEGRDCDGRVSTSGSDECSLWRLQSVPCYMEYGRLGLMRPDWQKVGPVRCYDQYAQAMGY